MFYSIENKVEIQETGEILEDTSSTGKKRPWSKRRIESDAIADSMRRLRLKGAASCDECGAVLEFFECRQGHKRLNWANFCRQRLCPMCQWRRSLRIVVDCRDVCHYALENTHDLRFLFLTLTIRNCLGTELSKTLNVLFNGWNRFTQRLEFRQAIVGWFRNLEVKYSRKRDDWHPHFHAILGVRQDYFYRKNIDYLSHDRLVELWQESLRVDYKPVIDIRVIKPQSDGSDALMSAVAETTKYITKVSDFIFPHNLARQDRVVLELAKAVKGRRLISYGGLLKEIHRELNKLDIEQADLIHLNGSVDQSCACAVCGSTLWLHVYKWIKELKEYVG